MFVDIFTLCESAQEYEGKLVIVGTFNRIIAGNFPVAYPEIAIVARIGFSKEEKGMHHLELSIKKEGEDIYLMNPAKMDADNSNAQDDHTFINLIFKGNNIAIPSPGTYKVILSIDGQVRESDLYVETKK